MRRVLVTISYDGTAYAGWQTQLNAVSVQQRFEEALFSVTGERIRVTGASRTDAGVHALGQRAHFDMECGIPPDKLPYALNTRLPEDIRVLAGEYVRPSFHARFDARGKEYAYRVRNSPHASALYRAYEAHVPYKLCDDAMARALKDIIGTHDFSAFQASGGTAKTTVRTITDASLTREGDLLTLRVKGDAFLYNMVRIIAGTMIETGRGKLPKSAFRDALETGDRLTLGVTAPACGLTLERVFYDTVT